MAQAGVKFVPGLGGAAGMQILDDMWSAVQHQDHHAFELEWQNRLHNNFQQHTCCGFENKGDFRRAQDRKRMESRPEPSKSKGPGA